jgi:hypothetical protein
MRSEQGAAEVSVVEGRAVGEFGRVCKILCFILIDEA